MTDATLNYYNRNAASFFTETSGVDMTPLYRKFLPLLEPGAHILDAGCGSGRDSLVFIENGFSVTAIDASRKLAELAWELHHLKVKVLPFERISWQQQFDAVWACASLLHVPISELSGIFKRLSDALKTSGILYCSFKYGEGERLAGGRYFVDMNEQALGRLLAQVGEFEVIETWVTADQRAGRADEAWINALLRKQG